MDDEQMHTWKVIKAEEGAGARNNGSTKAEQHEDPLHAQEAGHSLLLQTLPFWV